MLSDMVITKLSCHSLKWQLPVLICTVLAVVVRSTTTRPSGPLELEEDASSQEDVYLGQKLELRCPIIGHPRPTILWYKDNSLISSFNKRAKIKKRALVFPKLTYEDSGVYRCDAENKYGIVRHNITLRVLEPPVHDQPEIEDDAATTITDETNKRPSPPSFVNANDMVSLVVRPAGNGVTLRCRAQGHPTPEVVWLKDNQAPRRPDTIYKKWSMTLEHVTTSDDGKYTCIVSNSLGSINFTYTLEIQERYPHKPIIIDNYPSNQTVYVGQQARFECKFISDLHPVMYWLKHYEVNGSYLNSQEIPYVNIVKMDNDSDPQILLLNNVTLNDTGWYTCFVHNRIGTSVRSAWLTVLPWSSEDETLDGTNVTKAVPHFPMWAIIFLGAIILVIVVLLALCGALIYRSNMLQKKMKLANQTTNIVVRKKVVLVRQESGSSQNSIAPLVKIDYPRGPNDEELATISEYEIPPDPLWEFPRENLKFLEPLGQGAFGKVVKAEAKGIEKNGSTNTVAVKMLKEGHTDQEMADLISEMEVMKIIGKHVNIINLLGCCTQNGPLLVIVEYAANGNLKDFLRARRAASGYEVPIGQQPKNLTYKELIGFAYQVARGMEHLASKKCIHRDLAARNVLVMEDKVVKIADFGLARDIHHSDYYKKKKSGLLPIKWMALEALYHQVYTTKSDVWSFGVLMWEIMTLGGSPYPSIPSQQLYQLLKSGHRMEKPQNCSLEMYLMMRECWEEDPDKRPTFTSLVENLDRMLTIASDEEYLDLEIPALDTPPISSDSSDSDGSYSD